MKRSKSISFPNKLKQLILYFIILIFLGITGCEYKPTGTNYINKELTEGEINWVRPIQDEVIEMFYNRSIPYYFTIENYNFEKIEFYFLDTKIHESTTASGTCSINIYSVPDGNYTLESRIYVTNSSNSIAEHLGEARYIFYSNWPVIVDRTALSPCQLTDVSRFNGNLKISWEPYEGILFEKYTVNIGNRNVEIFDQSVTTYIDSSFCSGSVNYSIGIHARDDYCSSDHVEFEDYQPENLNYSFNTDDQLELSWDQSYYNNIQSYVIGSSSNINIHSIDETPNNETLTWIDLNNLLKFGNAKTFAVTPRNLAGDYEFSNVGNNVIQAYRGQYLGHSFSTILYNENGYFYTCSNNIIRCYNLETKELLGYKYLYRTETYFDYEPGNNHLYYAKSDQIIQLEPVSLETIAVYDNSSIFPNEFQISSFAASENRLVVSGGIGSPYYGGYIIDLPSMNIRQVNNLDEGLDITPDGEFVIDNRHLWQITNSSEETLMYLFNYDFKKILNNNQLLLISDGIAEIRSLPNLNVISTFSVSGSGWNYTISPDRQFIYKYYAYKLFVIRIGDGVEVLNMDVASSVNYFYLDNTVYSEKGYYLEVN